MGNGLKRGIATVFVSNLVVVCFSLITGFLLPKFLPEESYAAIRTFQLYITYIGILHFGYVDGMYLRYGGRELGDEINRGLSKNLVNMRFFQTAVAVPVLIGALISRDYIWIAIALSVLPVNMRAYYSFLYQAVGMFGSYGSVMTGLAFLQFAVNLVLVFLLRAVYPEAYVFGSVLVYVLIWIVLEVRFQRRYRLPASGGLSLPEIRETVVKGLPLLLGGLAALLMVNMDQWFVLSFMPTLVYARYTFAASVNGLLFNAITPVTTTLYNYFCRETEQARRLKMTVYVSVFAVLLPAAAFPVGLVIDYILPAYTEAKPVIVVLFGAGIFYTVINAIFVNLYKAAGQSKRYFYKMLLPLTIGICANFAGALYVRKMLFHTAVVLAVYLVWFVISLPDFRELKIPGKLIAFLLFETALFLVTGLCLPPVWGFFVYGTISGFFSAVLVVNYTIRSH